MGTTAAADAPETAPGADATSSAPTPRERARVAVVAVAGALLAWGVTTWLAASAVGLSAADTLSWARWDTGWYRTIALDGYSLGRCDGVALRTAEDWCGAAAWFPGYSYAMRAATWVGIEVNQAGRLIALAGLVTAFAVLWVAFLSRLPLRRAVPAMALAAVFPGSVYYGAIFPVSWVVASMLGTLALLQRRRWLLAGLCGVIATVSYSSGVTLGVVALVPLLSPSLGPFRERLRATFLVGTPMAIGYALVFANLERAVGRWDAWFLVQEGYGYEPRAPWTTLVDQARTLSNGIPSSWIGAQTMLVLGLVAVVVAVAASAWSRLDLGERSALVLATPLWLVPLSLGGTLSLYRAEAILLPMVVVLARSRAVVLWVAVAVAVPVAYFMARLFFAYVLI